MGARINGVASNTFLGPLSASSVEVVICTISPIIVALDNALIFFVWMFQLLVGTGATSVFMQVRRGTTISGATVIGSTVQQTVVAGNNVTISGCCFDPPGAVGPSQYSLTAQQSGATATGTAGNVCLLAFSL